MATRAREPSFIDPHRLYSRRGFIAASGISETRIRAAKQRGVELPWLICGKRKFLRGADAIAFIERLAGAK
jgi:hypothetical protein